MSNPRLAVFASGRGSNFQRLIALTEAGLLPCTIAVLISNRPDSGALQLAQSHGIESCLIDHQNFNSREDFDRELLSKTLNYSVDLVVLAGFMRILTPVFVDPLAGRIINLHPSLLPLHAGLNTHRKAIEAGDREHGASVHFVTEVLDAGPLIVQGAVPIRAADTPDILAERVSQQAEYFILPLALRWYCEGRLKLRSGRVLLDNRPLPQNGYRWDGGNIWSALQTGKSAVN